MTTAYVVAVSARARADLVRADAWMRERHPEEARTWVDDIDIALQSLTEMPERCPVARDVADPHVRQLIVGRHRLLFVIRGNRVQVLRCRAMVRRPMGH